MSPLIAKLVRIFGVVIFLATVFLAYSYPLIWNWNTQIVGLDTVFADTPQILSNLYLFQADLAAGNYGHTQELFYPIGASTWMHGLTPGMGLLYWLFGGSVFSFLNSFLLASFVLAGLGAYRLASAYTSSFFGALLVAFIYTFSSFHLAQWQDHYWYVINFTLPWYLLYFPRVFDFHPRHRFFRLASFKYLIVCFVLGIVSASLDYYTTFFLIYLSLFYALWKRYLSQMQWDWKPWKKILTIAIAFLLISLLIDGFRSAGLDDNHGLYWSGDVAGLIVPQNNAVYGNAFDSWLGAWQEPGPDEKNMFLGFSLIIALGFAKFFYWRGEIDKQAKNLFYVTAFLLVLCFPALKVFGHTLLKLPSALLHYIPFLNNIRVPTRWSILLFLFTGLFVARMFEVGIAAKWRSMAFLILSLALFIEYWPKTYQFFPEQDYTEAARQIKAQEGEVLMTLPFGVRDGFKMIGEQDNRFLYMQTIYHKKMLGGYFSRLSDEVFEYYQTDTLCHALMEQMRAPKAEISFPNGEIRFFEKFHPDILWIRKDYVNGPEFRLLERACEQENIGLKKVSDSLYLFEYR